MLFNIQHSTFNIQDTISQRTKHCDDETDVRCDIIENNKPAIPFKYQCFCYAEFLCRENQSSLSSNRSISEHYIPLKKAHYYHSHFHKAEYDAITVVFT